MILVLTQTVTKQVIIQTQKTSRQKKGSSAVSPVNQVGSDARKKRSQQSPPLTKQQRVLPNRGSDKLTNY